MCTAFSFLHTFSVSVLLNTTRIGRWNRRSLFCTATLLRNSSATSPHLRFYPRHLVYCSTLRSSSPSSSTFFEQLVYEPEESLKHEEDLSGSTEREIFNFDSSFESVELKRFNSPVVDVKELEELPEEWRRSRLAWLCKELPAHKHNTLIRILNAQRKWLRQEDATYIVCHCMRIRENEAAFRVYKWMMLQHWFQFDFALATKLADYLGKERKYLKCREVYDDILNQGRVPAESTFHILVVAYLSSSGQSVVEEAFSIYSRMIQLGGYRPRLSLHNSLFKALVGKQGGSFEETLKQAEFIYHNLTTSGLQIHKDIYGGLIWLHSYQDLIDKDRIALLRTEMRLRGIEESTDVLVSVLRACSKNGDAEEAERTWSKLLSSNPSPPPQAFMFRMVTYAKIGEHMKCLEIFRRMQEELGSTAVIAYHKIIEVLSKAEKLELAESIMTEFIDSGLGPLRPSFIDMMKMYSALGLHEKLESTFFQCLKKCRPNRKVFSIYLDSLVQIGSINEAGEVFNQMIENTSIGVNAHCCNSILRGYLSQGEHIKAEKVYGLMCRKKYDIDSSLIEKLSFVLSLRQKDVKEPIRQKLSIEQREVMVGLLLGGLQIKSDAERKKHLVHFEFSENLKHHSVLRRHIYDKYREWLACPDKLAGDDDDDDVPWVFTTIPHSYFGFYADQFWRKGQPTIPKLIHRWLSPRVLAYWYMYSGYRTSSGDILLRLKGSQEGIENIVKAFKAKSLDCRLKRKGSSFWIGFLGDKSMWFWKLVEPFILDDLKDCLRPGGNLSDDFEGIQTIDSGSESDEEPSECSDGEM
nr:pentatricopeptide repeat-containing protein At2g15820, chloroplastic [Ipomoea batatas]